MKFKTIESVFFFGFLGISTFLFFWLISDFAYTIFWAIFLTIVFYPLYSKLNIKLKGREILANVITIFLILTVFILPISFVSYEIVKEIPTINQKVLKEKNLNNLLEKIPFRENLDNFLKKNNIEIEDLEKDLSDSIRSKLNDFGKRAIDFSKNTLNLIINFGIMIYIIFFGLKDGKKYLLNLSKILPLGDKTERRLFNKFSSIVRSIFKGTLIVSVVQGSMAGILLFFLGFDAVLIWTILLIISAMIPAIGVSLILIPITLFMFLIGNVGSAIVLIVGMLIIASIDNILRPHLIGHETEMPDMFVTISILAGLSMFGVTGLIIGPVITGFFITMWHLFQEKYNDELDNNC